jgi:hypothetical protein
VSIQSWAPVLKQLGRTVISPGSIKLLYTQQVEGSFEMKFDVNFASSILHHPAGQRLPFQNEV